MSKNLPALARGTTLIVPADRIAALRSTLLAAYQRTVLVGRWVDRLERTRLHDAIVVGEAAKELKALIGHGGWGDWQRKNLSGVSARSLRDYMRLATHRAEIGSAANIREALAAVRRIEIEAKRERLREPGALPAGRFNCIAADIPWWFEQPDWLDYNVMQREEAIALPVRERAADDAVLFLWVPDRFAVDEVLPICEAWGFAFTGRFLVWVKTYKDDGEDEPPEELRGGNPHQIAPGRHELVAVATRGRPLIVPAPSSVFVAPRGARHSEKPDAFFELAERMVPSSPATRLELFARERREGWVGWGDQCPADHAPTTKEGTPVLPARAAAKSA